MFVGKGVCNDQGAAHASGHLKRFAWPRAVRRAPFPACNGVGLKADRASFPDISKALEKVALEKGYQLHAPWLNKCIQLYETYLVRHGIMLVRRARARGR